MAKFRRSIQPGGFRPEQVSTDNERRLQEHANRVIEGLRDQRNAVLSDRNNIAAAMKENAQIESNQAAFNQSIKEQNIYTQLKEQQALSQRAIQQYETRIKETSALFSNIADFSLTASKKLRKIEIEKLEQKDKALAGEIMRLGDNHPIVKSLKALKVDTQIEAVDAKTKLAQARERGADPLEVDEALKRLNGLGYHAKSAFLQHVSKQWQPYLTERFLSDVKEYQDPETGETFSGSEAARDPRRSLIVSAQALQQFEAIQGISGQLAALKQETGYYDRIFNVSESYAGVARRAKLEDNTQELLSDVSFKMRNTKDSTDLVNLIQEEWSTLRSRLGNTQALDFLTEKAKEIDADGNYTMSLEALAAAKIGPKGETFGEYWKGRIEDIKKARVAARNAVVRSQETNRESEATLAYRNSYQAAIDEQLAAAPPQQDMSILETAEAEFYNRYGVVPQALLRRKQQIQQENRRESEAKAALIGEKIRTGLATQGEILSIADPQLRAQAQAEYIKMTKSSQFGEDYEATFKAIKSGAKSIMGDSLEGAASFEAERLNLVMQKNFAEDYKKGLGLYAGDPTRALQYASDILAKDIAAAKVNTDKTARYYSESGPNNQKVFKNVRGLEKKTNAQKDQALNTLRDTIGAVGVSALDSPGLLGSEMELRKISEANRLGQHLNLTPQIKEAARLLGIGPIEAANQAIAALNKRGANILPIALDPALQAVDNARPETRALFTDNPTPGRVQRGAAELTGQSALRDPSNLRGGSGNVTAFRAAIIGQESGGRYDAVNPDSGALGIGQVMPENVGPWTKKYLGKSLTPKQFLSNKAAQDAVVNGRFRDMLADQNAAGYKGEIAIRRAAAVWYSGTGNLWNSTKPEYYNGRRYPSIAEYTKSIWDAYRRQF